jgi:hypothetical protein
MTHLHHGTYGGVEAQIHTWTLATDGGQPLGLHPGHFTPTERAPVRNKRGSGDCKTGLILRREISHPFWKLNSSSSVIQPAAWTLCLLRYLMLLYLSIHNFFIMHSFYAVSTNAKKQNMQVFSSTYLVNPFLISVCTPSCIDTVRRSLFVLNESDKTCIWLIISRPFSCCRLCLSK